MERNVLLVLVSLRKQSATKVQAILTDWGCYIKTRLGLHDNVLDQCSESGLIFLELVGDKKQHTEMTRKLNLLKGVSAQLVSMALDESE